MNSQFIKMMHSENYDPDYVGTVYAWDIANELLGELRPNSPIGNKCLWKAPIPSNLDIGEHIIEVKAVVDMFGRKHRQMGSYWITVND